MSLADDPRSDRGAGEPSAGNPPGPGAGPPPEIASFVLRFTQDRWQEPAGRHRARWRGQIRHVQSDAEARFTDFADAVAFMQAELARMTLASVADEAGGEQASVLHDSLRIWERFASGYAEAVSGAVQEGLGQSEDYQRQALRLFEQTLGAWNPWMSAPGGLGGQSKGSGEPGPGPGGSGRAPDEPPAGRPAGDGEPDAAVAAIEARLDALTRAVEALTAQLAGGAAAT